MQNTDILSVMTFPDDFLAIDREVRSAGAELVAVVKQRGPAEIQALINRGATLIGFGTVQDAEEKLPQLQFGGKTHLIGHLQKNKARKALELFDVIQSVDSLELAQRLDRIAGETGKLATVFLQVNISRDPHKFGFDPEKFPQQLAELAALAHLNIGGLMMIGRADVASAVTRQDFAACKSLFDSIKKQGVFGNAFQHLSMGMSDDYRLALAAGATMVRIGSALFA